MKVKIKRKQFDKIYFSSDFHFNHEREFLWKPRGFESSKDHDNWIEEELKKLTKNDLLVFLGDTSLNSSIEETERFIFQIKAKKFWVWGNHKSWDFPIYKKFAKIGKDDKYEIYPVSVKKNNEEYESSFGYKEDADIVFFGESFELQIERDTFYCKHMASLVWDEMKNGFMALCGHSHGSCKLINPENKTNGKILDIGVDNAKKLFNLPYFTYEQIVDIMKEKPIQRIDHHK